MRPNNAPDRTNVCNTIRDALERLRGIEGVYATTTGLVAYAGDDNKIKIDVRLECHPTPNHVQIINDAMIVLDQDGNGCTMHQLSSLTAARRQLRRWQDEYTFDYDKALSEVSKFFAKAK